MAVPAVVVSPIVGVFEKADLPPLDPGDRAGTAGVAVSLVEVFERVPDPRRARGIRHGVVAMLLLGACAVLTGARSFAAIGEYAHDTGRLVLDRLGVAARWPHACTIRRVLSDVDPVAVEAAMRLGAGPTRQTPAPQGAARGAAPVLPDGRPAQRASTDPTPGRSEGENGR